MQRVMVGWRVIVGHVEPRSLALHKVTHIVNQPLGKDIVVDAVERRHSTVQQEHADHRQQIGQTDRGRQHAAHGVGDAVDQQFENIQIGKRQQAGEDHIEEPPPERSGVAPAHHHQGLPQVLHELSVVSCQLLVVRKSVFFLSPRRQVPHSSSGAGSRAGRSSPGAGRRLDT